MKPYVVIKPTTHNIAHSHAEQRLNKILMPALWNIGIVVGRLDLTDDGLNFYAII